MTLTETHGGVEPAEWFLVFHPRSDSTWRDILTPGWAKHVSAFGYVAGRAVWVLHDSNWSGIQVIVYSHDGMKAAFAAMVAAGCRVVKVARGNTPMEWRSRLGLWCTIAVKHIILCRSIALTPTGLYHHVLRNGGMRIDDGATNQDRPRSGDTAGTGSERPYLVADQ